MQRTISAGIVLALVAGFVADYPWGDWVGHTHWARVAWIPFLMGPLTFHDVLQNLLQFSPVGALVALGWPRRAGWRAAGLTLPVSVLGEWTQLYSHTRFPSMTDVTCNVAGAAVAALLVGAWRRSHVSAEV